MSILHKLWRHLFGGSPMPPRQEERAEATADERNGIVPGATPVERKVIACNLLVDTKAASMGAAAYIVDAAYGNACNSVLLVIRTRTGRWVEKWERTWRVGCFRLKTLAPEDPRFKDERIPDRFGCRDVEGLNGASRRERQARGLPEITADELQQMRRRGRSGPAEAKPADVRQG